MAPPNDDDDQLSVDTPTRKSRRIASRQQHQPMEGVVEEEVPLSAPAARAARKRKTDDDSVASSKGSRASRSSKRLRTKKAAAANNEGDSNEEDSKLPAIVVTEAASTIYINNAEPAARSVPITVDNIRIPASHTPGKASTATERLRSPPDHHHGVADNLNPSAASAMNSSSNEIPRAPGLRLNFGNEPPSSTSIQIGQYGELPDSRLDELLANHDCASDTVLLVQQQTKAVAFRARHTRSCSRNIDLDTTFTSFQDVFMTETNVIEASKADPFDDLHENNEPPAPKPSLFKRALHNPVFWLLPWLLLTFVTRNSIFWPAFYSMATVSDEIVSRLQPVVARFTQQQAASPEQVQLIVSKLDQAAALQGSLKAASDELSTLTTEIEKLNSVLEEVNAKRQGEYEHAFEVVTGARSVLERALDHPDRVLDGDELAALKEQLQTFDGVDRFLLDVSFIDSWAIPDTTRNCQEIIDATPETDLKQIELLVESLKREAALSVDNVMSKEFSDVIHGWVRDDLAEPLEIFADKGEAFKALKPLENQSVEMVDAWVKERLEIEQADQSGKTDYASLLNGGRVIRSGKWATSLSLKDELPLLNRMADVLGLRFYGYGPEAALTPVVPFATLGQCWSFQQHAGPLSDYGLLSFRLSNPIKVRSISIEHPPKEVTDRVKTSIRSFRVLGFEDAAADSEPWNLGAFEYSITGAIRQEFNLAQVQEEREVPELQSIALAVDSNWGAEFSCLYRVRVFT